MSEEKTLFSKREQEKIFNFLASNYRGYMEKRLPVISYMLGKDQVEGFFWRQKKIIMQFNVILSDILTGNVPKTAIQQVIKNLFIGSAESIGRLESVELLKYYETVFKRMK